MPTASDATRPFTRSMATHVVLWVSVLYALVCAVQVVGVVITMISRLSQRTTGIEATWNPGIPAPQPTNFEASGGPSVLKGTTMYLTQAQGTVVGVPASSIVLTSAGDLVGLLCGIGVAVCLVVLARQLLRGTPFASASVKALLALAAVVFVGYEGATLLHALGTLGLTTVMVQSPSTPDGSWNPPASQTVFFELWPVYVAIALLALAAVFRFGSAREAADAA